MVETGFEQIHMPTIGEDAPPFTAVTTRGPINFPDDSKENGLCFSAILLTLHPYVLANS